MLDKIQMLNLSNSVVRGWPKGHAIFAWPWHPPFHHQLQS